jgi:ribosome-binding factor A
MESNRHKKVEGQFKKDLSEIFREMAQSHFQGVLLSVTRVTITTDFSLARCYVSIFPVKDKEELVVWLNEQKNVIKNNLVQKLKGSLRKMPNLTFYLDDSIDQEEEIDKILKGGGESPIK